MKGARHGTKVVKYSFFICRSHKKVVNNIPFLELYLKTKIRSSCWEKRKVSNAMLTKVGHDLEKVAKHWYRPHI